MKRGTPAGNWIFPIGCGFGVANLYFNQTMLPTIAHAFGAGTALTGSLVTFTQIGYALGVLFIVPLADTVQPRTLCIVLSVVTALNLALCALAPALFVLAACSLVVAFTTAFPQVLIPFGVSLAPRDRQAQTIAFMQTGLITGILLSRTASGGITAWLGWRSTYAIAAAAMLVLAVAFLRLPRAVRSPAALDYRLIGASMAAIVRESPAVRLSAVLGGLMFAGYHAVWATMAFFVNESHYHMGPAQTGLVALYAFGGALLGLRVAAFADRIGHARANAFAIACFVTAMGLLWAFGSNLFALVGALNLLNFSQQIGQIANQSRIFAALPEARGRTNSLYMATVFSGGALGSLLAVHAYERAGWAAVCAIGLVCGVAAGGALLCDMCRSGSARREAWR